MTLWHFVASSWCWPGGMVGWLSGPYCYYIRAILLVIGCPEIGVSYCEHNVTTAVWLLVYPLAL